MLWIFRSASLMSVRNGGRERFTKMSGGHLRASRAKPSSGVECSHQSCVLGGLWSGQRWDWRNGACGVRTGTRLTPLSWAGGHLDIRHIVLFIFVEQLNVDIIHITETPIIAVYGI